MNTAPIQALTGARLWLAAIGLALANFVVILDTTITNVSVPHIAGGLAISPSQGTWTITSYAVAEAITVPLTGWLAARFGTYRTLVVSLVGFAVFSVLCGLARTIELMVVLRVFQGLCGGPLMPLTQTLILRIFPQEKIGTANAIWGVTTISAPILGPIVGGYISDNWSWPWIFYINLPVVLLCLGIIVNLVGRYETPTERARIDTIGLVLLVLFVGCFQLVLDLGREHDWFGSNMIIALAITSFVAFGAFVIWELTDPHPVVDLRVLRHRSLWVGLISMALGFGGMFSTIVLVPLWLQSVIGYSASEAGHAMAFVGVFAMAMAPIAGKAFDRFDYATSLDPGYLDARFNKASVLLDAGDYTRAKAELDVIVGKRPDDWGAQVALGLALRGQKDFDPAKKLWQTVVDKAPRRSRARGDALWNLAVLKSDFLEDVPGAKADLERFLQDAGTGHPKRVAAEQKRKELGL